MSSSKSLNLHSGDVNGGSIVFVGNGTAVTDKKMGEKIDSFDTVVRFNNYQTEGFEEYVGTKTNIWITRICDTIKLRPEDDFDEIIGVINYCKWTNAILPAVPKWVTRYPEMSLIKHTHVKTYIEEPEFKFHPSINWLTVGFIALKTFFDIGWEKIHIYGYGGDINKHYHPHPVGGQEHHRFDLEADYIKNKWEEKGKVVRI